MNNTRLLSLIRKEFVQILRDPRTLALVIVIPVLQLFLLGYSASNDVRNVPMAVFNQDRGPAARELLDAFRVSDQFDIRFEVYSEDELRQLIDDGDARVGLIIPPDYSALITGNQQAQVAFVLDGSDPSVASTSLSAAQLIGQAYATDVQADRLARAGQAGLVAFPLEVRTQVWYNPDLEDAYFMVPGIIGMILYSITSILTANAIVRERERGTIEQLIVTPIRPWELMAGKLVPYVILALINTVEVLVIGSLWFGVPVRGSLLLIMALSSLFLLSSLGIGLLASTIANTQQEAMLTVWMTMLPAIFLSGFFFPLEAMPVVLQWVSLLMPLRYYLNIIRVLLLKGVGLAAIWPDVLALTIFGLVLMAAASLRFRKRLD
ncbi:MAG: ABC transporter permease [Chloroflexi bacterium]|nr:MAG: ABC transporter permease [Chloroflexota bacterium]MBL1197410.1 ABC transporter permease [Chloroflexota bacterium]NOH14706.1 ABC transporter permease [Chloroflexota bacterium]